MLKLIGEAAARVRATLWREHHSQCKPKGTSSQGTPYPDVYGAFS